MQYPYYIRFLLLVVWVVACKSSEKVANEPSNERTAIPSVQHGWDIYTAGTYRYGPSIIVNEDQSIDVWFAAEGDRHGDRLDFFAKDEQHLALRIAESSDKVAQKFDITKPFYALSVMVPTWHSTSSSVRLSLYKWNRSYDISLAQEPMKSIYFENIKDNSELMLIDENMFPAGEYIWVLSEAKGTPGIWFSNLPHGSATNYWNGEIRQSGNFESSCLLEKSSGVYYWDKVVYRHSNDGGKTWTPDEVVLTPTDGGRDEFSTCDPGVVKYGDYYYLAYTSTEDIGMVDNDLYLCRARTPRGTWEKWNGNGWGGMPQPVIEFTGNSKMFGVGEPSMVIVNDTLYMYYSWNDVAPETTTTRVATAPILNENWPALLTHHGTAINKSAIKGSDHIDVKYRTDLKLFYALHTASRFSKEAHLLLWESKDGIHFKKAGVITEKLQPYLHNCGWGGDQFGHVNPRKPTYVGYAYGEKWGAWNTHWHRLQF